jgi:hypothetical protein
VSSVESLLCSFEICMVHVRVDTHDADLLSKLGILCIVAMKWACRAQISVCKITPTATVIICHSAPAREFSLLGGDFLGGSISCKSGLNV